MRDSALRAASLALGSLPDGVGQFHVAHRLIGAGQATPRVRRVRMRNGAQMVLDVHDRTQGIAFLLRRFDAELAAHIVDCLPERGVFVDAGANVGLVSFAVARRRASARIFGFEPYPPTAAMWARNKELNGATCAELVELALSDADGTVEIGLDGGSDSGSGRIDAPHGNKFEVTTMTLDAFAAERGLAHIDVLKLDVQGHEPQVLRGARELLERCAIRTVLAEANDGDALGQILSEAGYSAQPVPPVGLRRYRRSPPMGDVSYRAPAASPGSRAGAD